MLARLLPAFAALALVSTTVSAADLKSPIGRGEMVVGKNGRLAVTAPPAGSNAGESQTPYLEPGDVTIFSNLAKKYHDGTYWCCSGYEISGPSTGSELWEAQAFTPAADISATKIMLGLGYVEGTNAVGVTLNSDNGGVPGTELAHFKVTSMPVFGSCCVLARVKHKAGVPLTGGQQYWVVVKTDSNDPDVLAIWNQNDTEQINYVTVAYNFNEGGWQTQSLIGAAVGVFGQ